jgi:alpha-tubulin suppressor-like RCC1 family protein
LGQGNTSNIGDQAGEMAALQPINFGAGRTAVEISAGKYFTCARLDNNAVKCWGRNESGFLGQGNTTPLGVASGDIAAAPALDFGTGLTPRTLAVGHDHSCALLSDNAGAARVKCWGDNQWGQLGQGNRTQHLGDQPGEMGDNLPFIDFGTGLSATQVRVNGGHTCAILNNGAVKCWGLNTWGQLGLDLGNSNPPNEPAMLLCTGGPRDCIGDAPGEMGDALAPAIAGNAARLIAGFRHNCALLTSGELKCWGSNEQAQLGLGTIAGNSVRIGDQAGEMAALATTALKAPVVEELAANGFYTCVWNTDDTLNCWGDNAAGQLGHNDTATWGDGPNEMGASLPDTSLGT